jgi:cytochrome c553
MSGSGVLFVALCAVTAAASPPRAVEEAAASCRYCHRTDNPPAWIPTLEGQTREYLYNQLRAYKTKRRPDPWMLQNVAALSDRQMRKLANYFAARRPQRGDFRIDPQRVERGRAMAAQRGCAACHGAGFAGNREAPRLAGMVPQYVSQQIVAFVSGRRPHPGADGLQGIGRDDAEDLAHFLAHLE